jgi:hypothetical protein
MRKSTGASKSYLETTGGEVFFMMDDIAEYKGEGDGQEGIEGSRLCL